jgi:hypothetical protein
VVDTHPYFTASTAVGVVNHIPSRPVSFDISTPALTIEFIIFLVVLLHLLEDPLYHMGQPLFFFLICRRNSWLENI